MRTNSRGLTNPKTCSQRRFAIAASSPATACDVATTVAVGTINASQSPSAGRVAARRTNSEIDVATGENDCGLFFFDARRLFEVIENAKQAHRVGAETKEFNFLPLIPQFEETVTIRVRSSEETLGVNSPEEAQKVSEILARRRDESDGE